MALIPTDLRPDGGGQRLIFESIINQLLEWYQTAMVLLGDLTAGTLKLNTTLSGTPVANQLYKAASGVGFDFALDASSAVPALRPILDAAQGGIAAGAAEGWHEIGAASEPTFVNSWVNFGGAIATAAFRKLPGGLVVLKGSMKDGTLGTDAFILPVGYRPAAALFIEVASVAGTSGRLQIESNGVVSPVGGNNAIYSVNCSFFAEG